MYIKYSVKKEQQQVKKNIVTNEKVLKDLEKSGKK